jgi:hypothetical protein
MFKILVSLNLAALLAHYGLFACHVEHCCHLPKVHTLDWLTCGFHLLLFLAYYFLFVCLLIHRHDGHTDARTAGGSVDG